MSLISPASIRKFFTQVDPTMTLYDKQKFELYKSHIINKIESHSVGQEPFYHMYIENIFPKDLYVAIKERMLHYKYSDALQSRQQDSSKFVNNRYNLANNDDLETQYIRALFSDKDIKNALLQKFYFAPTSGLAELIKIHTQEFEFMYTKADRFQNIHVDIPPKFMSLVFYIPENQPGKDEEERNATVLYDKSLNPHHNAKYKANSLCVFVPHFYSYHGFSSTIDREVLIMFYINEEERKKWKKLRNRDNDIAPYDTIKDCIKNKLEKYPLIEYEHLEKINEKNQCLINAPQGRVLIDENGEHIPV